MGHSAGMSHGAGFSSHAGGMTGMHSGSPGTYHSGYHGCYNCGYHYSRYYYPYNSYYARYGYRYPYYGYGYGYYWPWWWDSSSSYDNSDSSYQDDASARQIDDLNQQVQQLRNQLSSSQYAQSEYGPPAPSARVPRPADSGSQAQADRNTEKLPATPDLATVLVFRDQRIQEIKNYAIVGKTLVVIADQRQRKIPLADLDLDATTKLNEERGVDFQIPR